MNLESVKKSLEAKGIKDEVFTIDVNGKAVLYSVWGLLEMLNDSSSPQHFTVLGHTLSHPETSARNCRMIFIDIAKALTELSE